jgi:tetratricopeptide (TPR) repeat protein
MASLALKNPELGHDADNELQLATDDNDPTSVRPLRRRGQHDPAVQMVQCLDGFETDQAYRIARRAVGTAANDVKRRLITRETSGLLCAFADMQKRTDVAAFALTLLRDAVDRDSGHADLQNALGRAYTSLGALESSAPHLNEAIKAYDTALKLTENPAFRTRVTINKAIALWQLASLEELSSTSLLTEAEKLLRRTFEDMPDADSLTARLDMLRARESLGNVLLSQDRLTEALTCFEADDGRELPAAARARMLNNLGAYYEKKYGEDTQQTHWIDQAVEAYEAALALLSKEDMPLEWSRTQLNRGAALTQKAAAFADNRDLLEDAILALKKAREVCSDSIAPALRVQINIRLGDAFAILSIIETNIILQRDAVGFYDEALSKADKTITVEICDKIARLSLYFNRLHLNRLMDRLAGILSSLQSVVGSYGITRDEWPDISARISEQLSGQGAETGPAGAAEAPDQARPATVVEAVELAPQPGNRAVPPMPTTDELRAAGKLYSQAHAAAEAEGRKYNIIDHLLAVWTPWIEAGELTRPILYQGSGSEYGDRSAYKALATWLSKEGHDLKAALGHEIPSKSDIVSRRIAEFATLPSRERPAHVDWVLQKRRANDPKKGVR